MAPTQPLPEHLAVSALVLSVITVSLLAAPVAAQGPPCSDALSTGEVMARDTTPELIAADLTLDGATDAAYWWVDGSQVVVLIGTCDDNEVAQQWRFVFDASADCPPPELRVEAASLLLDEALVERTCAGEQSSSECAHLRRENERRQSLMDDGGRALRIGGASCTVAMLRWSPAMSGFMEIR